MLLFFLFVYLVLIFSYGFFWFACAFFLLLSFDCFLVTNVTYFRLNSLFSCLRSMLHFLFLFFILLLNNFLKSIPFLLSKKMIVPFIHYHFFKKLFSYIAFFLITIIPTPKIISVVTPIITGII